jgi:hypothetical protein
MVGRGGLEPPTSRLSGVRSNHLSYRPIRAVARVLYTEEIRGRPGSKGSSIDALMYEMLCLHLLLSVSRLMRTSMTRNILRKEVIQPQVPLRLPCYDFTPVADPTVVRCLP